MPWSGGVFSREVGPSPLFTGPTVWQQDAVAGELIFDTRHDFHDQDLADGINATLNKNGQNSPTANINWGGFKITSLGYGSATTDAAAYGQVPIAASLNAGTNVLTLTPADATLAFDVDLTPLVVGGSTANFAKLNAGLNAFQGAATFDGAGGVGIRNAINLIDQITVTGGSYTWTITPPTPATLDIQNTAGAVLAFSGNSGTATLKINGNQVWDQSTLTPAQVSGMLTAASSPTLTGSWNFNAASVILPQNVTLGATGGGWQTSIAANALSLFSIATGATMQFDNNDTGSTARMLIGGHRAWNNGNMRVFLSGGPPTGGASGDIAFYLTGANTGVWGNNAGTWVKIAS